MATSTMSDVTTCTDKAKVKVKKPFVIGVSGGAASGKSSVCDVIMRQLGQDCVSDDLRHVQVVRQDSFYRSLTTEEHARAQRGLYNFDHPDAFDAPLMQRTLTDILAGHVVTLPSWDHVTHSRPASASVVVRCADVLLVEGILVFYFPELRGLLDMRLFVDTDPDTRLARRVIRDVEERGRDIEQVLQQYTDLVKPAFEQFCLPTKKYADVIIPRGADNSVAVDLIVKHIKELMRPDQPGRSHKNMSGIPGGSPTGKMSGIPSNRPTGKITRSLSCFNR